MKIPKFIYLKAKEIVLNYEEQENDAKVDKYFTEYSYLKDAISAMEHALHVQCRTIYCYRKSNDKYVISFIKLVDVNPIHTMYYIS